MFCFWFFYKEESFEISLVNAIAVLIIACPCALALATPVSNLVALGRALKKHILFKSSSVIEDLSKCDCVVFDKTGILTKIELELKEVFLDKALDLNELYNFVKLSKHPISQNIVLYLKQKGAKDLNLDFKKHSSIQAKGLSAELNEGLLLGGSSKFLQEKGIVAKEFDNTHFIFAKEGKILAFFEFDSVLEKVQKSLSLILKKKRKN